jgi:plastocyanin
MNRRKAGLFAAVAAAAATMALAPAGALGGARAAARHSVTLKNIRFHPGTLSISRGDSVTWVWRERTKHNVTFSGFHSRTQTSGSYTVRFAHGGTFNYRCTIHEAEGMRGRIVVH